MKRISFHNRLFKTIQKAKMLLKMRYARVKFIAKIHFDEILGNCYDGYFLCYPH